jgi:DNA-binding CsgD family transcriptional regulator
MPLELSLRAEETLSRSDYRSLLLVIRTVNMVEGSDESAQLILESLARLIPYSTGALGVPVPQLLEPVPGPFVTAGLARPIAAADWPGRHRGHHALAITLVGASGPVGTLVLQRPPLEPEFSEREREMLELLRPHFARALGATVTGERSLAPLDSPRWSFSERQQQIVAMIVDGRSYKEIASSLAISTETVKDHLRRVFTRLGVQSRGELAARVLGLR